MTFEPTSVEVTCMSLPKDHFVQVPWKYVKVCGYNDLFSKTWTKGHWPLDDLWPYICWGHMCDSTQGSLCTSPMGVHQCMWIEGSILQNTTYILCTYYVHTTYILHTWVFPVIRGPIAWHLVKFSKWIVSLENCVFLWRSTYIFRIHVNYTFS